MKNYILAKFYKIIKRYLVFEIKLETGIICVHTLDKWTGKTLITIK